MTDPAQAQELARRYNVPLERIQECLQIQEKVAAIGLPQSLEEILLKKGYVAADRVSELATADVSPKTDFRIDGYDILERIGKGGMGAVYRAHQKSLDRTVAIKTLLPRYAREPDAVDRFLREAKALARLNHPNIVSGIDAGVSNGTYFYVMEFLEGIPLDRILKERKTLPWREAATIVLQMARALDHAMRNSVVHRDIKPGNIIVLADGSAKLADLGLARIVSQHDAFMTHTGLVFGTPAYISPEHAQGRTDIDIRADIYSLGVTFYHTLTGNVPFRSDETHLVLERRLHEDVRLPADAAPDLPRDLRSVVHRMCRRKPEERYDTPAQLVQDLEAVLAGRPIQAVPRTAAARAPRKDIRLKLALGIGAGVVPLSILLIVLAMRPHGPATPPPQPDVAPPPVAVVDAPPTKPDASVPPPESAAELEAARALQEAVEFELRNREQHEAIVERFEAATRKSRDTKRQPAAEAALLERRERLQAAIRERAKSLHELATALVRGSRYGDAYDRVKAADGAFQDGAWKEVIRREETLVTDEARVAAEAALETAAMFARQERWEEAQKAITGILSMKVPSLVAQAQQELVRLRSLEADVRRRAVEEETPVRQYLETSLQHVRRRQYDLATQEGRALLESRVKTRAGREALETRLKLLEPMAAVVKPMQMRLHAILPGTQVEIDIVNGPQPVRGIVKTSLDGAVEVRDKDGKLQRVSIENAATWEILAAYDAQKGRDLKLAAAFALLDGHPLLAEEHAHFSDFKPDAPFRALADQVTPQGQPRTYAAYRFAARRPENRKNFLVKGGGGADTEKAVLLALLWLARHQNPDGSWSVNGYVKRCEDSACKPNPGGAFDEGVTGLATLAFLGAGYTHLSSEEHDGVRFGDVVRRALDSLIRNQDKEGCLARRTTMKYVYAHAIATAVLAEASGLSGSPVLEPYVQKAVDFLVAAQNPGKGWRYSVRSGDSDSSVSGWAVTALKSAETSGLVFPRSAYDGIRSWFDEVTEGHYFRVGYTHNGTGKVYVPGLNENFGHHETLSAIGVMARMIVDRNPADPMHAGAAGLLSKDLPVWKDDEIDFYYWHWATLALFQIDGPGGQTWKAWNDRLKEALVRNQNPSHAKCKAGSWETVDRWSCEGGRVYATALNALTLETYYRHERILPEAKRRK